MENPILKQIEDKYRRDRHVSEAFEKWFDLCSAAINPLMTKEDARAVFKDGFDLGSSYNMGQMLGSITSFIERKPGSE